MPKRSRTPTAPRPRETRVLLVVPLRMRFGRDVARGVAAFAERRGWTLRADDDPPDMLRPYLETHGGEYRGVIGAFSDEALIRYLANCGLPAVNVSNRGGNDLPPRVISDDIEAGRLAARHFLAKGYASFAFMGFAGHRYSEERAAGFSEELAARGRSCRRIEIRGGDYDYEKAQAERARRLRALPKPLALFAANDIMARHAALACRAARLAVPDEVAILGADDDETESWLAGVPLSSVRMPFEAIGERAARLLAELLRGAPPPADPIRLPPTGVIERRSTDVAAVDDPILSRALQYAREAPAVAATLQAAAAHAGVSVRTLQYRCRARLGRRFHEVALDLRMQRARQMLMESNRTVAEVAGECGLGGPAQFSRLFRRHFGAAPVEFRRLARGK